MLRPAFAISAMAFLTASFVAGQETQTKSPEAKPADSNVLVLKAPAPPPDQPQLKPLLRAVDLEKRQKLNDGTRLKLIQLLDAEFVHTRKFLPLGDKNTVITPEGEVKPNDARLFQTMQGSGAAAKIGDKVQITNIAFHEKSIYFEINGGPKKKSKWYQHITISGMGGSAAAPDSNQSQATGSALTLQFNKQVPEMTGDELKKLLSPVLDFSVKSAAEVYMETLPPKIKAALKNHDVLVGMNKDMVVMAKDRPEQKVREKDDQGKEYEEWIYGAPPKDVVFVRFNGDEVTQVKTAKVGGEIIVKNEKEVDVHDGVATLAALKASNSPQDVKVQQPQEGGAQPKQPAHRPTLRREGDEPDVLSPPASTQAPAQAPPAQTPSDHGDEPQWGTDKKGSSDQDGPAPGQQKPPDF